MKKDFLYNYSITTTGGVVQTGGFDYVHYHNGLDHYYYKNDVGNYELITAFNLSDVHVATWTRNESVTPESKSAIGPCTNPREPC